MKHTDLVLRIEKNRVVTGDGRDDLFGPREDWNLNACLNFSADEWDLYAQGFRRAAERICKAVIESRGDKIDSLVYPVLSLYRHYLELRIKHIVSLSHELLGRPGSPPLNHKLPGIWATAEENLAIVAAELDSRDIARVRIALTAFQKLDPHATAFRYPIDKKGDQSLPNIMHINLGRVFEELSAVGDILDFVYFTVDGFLDLKKVSDVQCLW